MNEYKSHEKTVPGVDISPPGTTQSQRVRSLWVAFALSTAFLCVSALQSAHSFYSRIVGSSMTAATRAAWTGQAARDVAFFIVAQLTLHLVFGLAAWCLAWATTVALPATRRRFNGVLLLWFCVLAAAVIAYNAVWYPWTGLGEYYHNLLTTPLGSLEIGRAIYLVVAAAALLTLSLAAARDLGRHGLARFRIPLGVGGALLAIALVSTLTAVHGATKATSTQQRPNVIVIGIDSLRLDYLQRFGGGGILRHVDDFVAKADVVRDTTTPVARTYSSWSAILSGRDPLMTGARFNLAVRQAVRVNPTIGDVLRKAGYHTVYSTDEVRFANIDESYGFDQVITPPIGAIDFVIGSFNELPLATLVANSTLGKWLFPYSYANRGAATMYQPQTYLRELDRELSFDDPTLFMVHLTASHWPYFVSDTPYEASKKKNPDDRPTYRVGVEVADSMFGDIVSMLERKGALENAIVVVLSDHGEALELPRDTMIADGTRIAGLRAPIVVADYGHGQSVLSPVQYQVLLGFRSFGPDAGFEADGRDLAGGASVEDIAPTLLQLLGVSGDPLSTTGQSLAPALQGERGAGRVAVADRVRFTETDLRVLPRTDGGIDEAATAEHNARFFEVDPESGRMHVREDFVPLVVALKERAAFTDNLLLAALPAGPDAHQYLLVDKATGTARLLLNRPGPDAPEEQHLWDEMWRHYAGELRRPVSITREDWPIIEAQWNQFFVMREARATGQAVAK
jgi:arylsulfatase A-like enzyme